MDSCPAFMENRKISMLKALSVSELSKYISQIFESEELLQYIKVYGEVSNLHYVRGNVYFNLKDEGAVLSCIMFGVDSLSIAEGDEILATGTLRYYTAGGKLNLYVNAVSPYGSGVLFKRFLELKNKLEEEGIFDKKYKKPLPKNIKTIGVITSKTGAVLHDIQTVSHRRNPFLNIIVYPTKVQGDGADKEIINGLQYFDKREDIDIIIIARGGGSIEDLQPFNSEALARQIVKVNKMVISAVGHETDFTICDFASSLRCATPSEAAEIVSQNVTTSLDNIRELTHKAYIIICNKLDDKYSVLDKSVIRLNSLYSKIIDSSQNQLKLNIIKLVNSDIINAREQKLKLLENKLNLLNPESILNRGFARITKKGQLIKSAEEINCGDVIDIELNNGKLSANILHKETK